MLISTGEPLRATELGPGALDVGHRQDHPGVDPDHVARGGDQGDAGDAVRREQLDPAAVPAEREVDLQHGHPPSSVVTGVMPRS
jgi:hypothetical protein